MKNTGFLYALLGLSLCITLLTACTGKATSEETILGQTDPAKAKNLALATAIINNRCPEAVDPETRLDSVRLSPAEDQLIYFYTLPNKDGTGINAISFTAYLLPNIIENVRSNPDLRMHRDSSLTFVFNYRGQQGEPITEFSVGPDRYR